MQVETVTGIDRLNKRVRLWLLHTRMQHTQLVTVLESFVSGIARAAFVTDWPLPLRFPSLLALPYLLSPSASLSNSVNLFLTLIQVLPRAAVSDCTRSQRPALTELTAASAPHAPPSGSSEARLGWLVAGLSSDPEGVARILCRVRSEGVP